ncbi:hypothetical protein GH714_022196 [Hevea brasiliensis]|uniref:Disease resistance R13L4/SHOC-2-like LRR domain-containing protein n=1 Tax=Hevea brasiliensis TaxID=3981 RepID=A0A6A6KUU2_HEVBR|nr:hypothetical protein GH714_022196 [Hevea brasiliensis]
MMRAWPCFNSSKALSVLVILAFQNWNHGNSSMEKEVTAAHGMVWSVTKTNHVVSLDLSGCCLFGSINSNSTLFRLVHLQNLNLAYNDFNYSQIPSQIGLLSSLTRLNLSISDFSGQIPPQVLNLSSLISLDLSYNYQVKLHKPSLRDLVQKFTNLKLLDLSSNNIQGPIPSWLWNISKNSLEYMNLSYNFLTGFEEGPIVLQWAHLSVLDIRSNMIQGSLLSVPSNYFDGSISPTWRNGCNLRFISLNHNRLQGQVPQSLANCSMLEFIDFGENQLNDSFPSWLGNLPELRVLILRSNRFHGALRKVGTDNFSALQIIDLSENKFTGDLPTTYFEMWDAMKIVNTSYMKYIGELSTSNTFPCVSYDNYDYSITINNKGLELEYLKIPSTLAAIDFSCNRFEGAIPNVIGNLKAVHLLNLSNNMLTGHIPSSLANMKELECLDLSSNRLSGQVPMELSQLTYLSSFNVSWNHLSGPVPQGKQFDTFDSNSYKGNSRLCGALLEKKCADLETIPSTSSTFTEDEDLGSFFKTYWMIIFIGYAGGLIVGVAAGNEVTKRKHDWFVKTFGKNY